MKYSLAGGSELLPTYEVYLCLSVKDVHGCSKEQGTPKKGGCSYISYGRFLQCIVEGAFERESLI